MGTSPRRSHLLPLLSLGLVSWLSGACLTRAGQPGTAPPSDAPVPQSNFFSTLTQAFKQDFEHQVVRGHFDVGSPPDAVHRYYCLVDARTGKRQANGVAGALFQRADGMTGIKGTAVSLYSCAGSEQQGLLVTAGYFLVGGAAAKAAASVPVVPPASAQPITAPAIASSATPAAGTPVSPGPPAQPAATQPAPAVAGSPAYRVDVAGVKLGMSVDEVRAVLKSKKLLDYHESTQTLGHLNPASGATPPATGGRFINVVAAWTAPVDGDGESFAVMFTPVPGRERAMAISHSVAYSRAHAVHLSALTGGLVKKYGGYTESDAMSAASTWRVQDTGVQVGDSCKRRELFGGPAEVVVGKTDRPNLALKTTPEEFRYQIDLCGVAIVTEDHVVANVASTPGEHVVTRFTVTAYSPSIGFEGATAAAQLMQAGIGITIDQGDAARARDAVVPDL